MKPKVRESLDRELHRQWETLLREVARDEADLQFIAEDRESELEERAQEERAARLLARLDERGKRQIEEIDAAVRRMKDGTYGTCTECGLPIAVARLQALPAARLCVKCARAKETRRPVEAEEEEVTGRVGALPADLSLLTDREVETALREDVRQDGRVDMEELRIVCRHGVAYVDGAVPSEAEHQIVRKLLTDVAGLQEIVDRVQVKELLWEREDRSRAPRPEVEDQRFESAETEDVVKSTEEGIAYVPPVEPPPEEE